ncbi:MAG: ABC transporter ATP-binding protein [Blautia sp.]|nr:ABC transporter ATP-binding protein [Blautia sp.]MDY4000153.1 ABC transporter ATP-binding protein [Blautia sp.]
MRFENVKKSVGDFQLEIPDLLIEEGKIHGFIGGNGSGKTTTAKLIMDILKPDSGKVNYDGLLLKDITMTAQRPYLLHASVYENLIYPLKIRGIRLEENKLDSLLKEFGLFQKKKQYAGSLSSGERQKLSMLRAMVFQPKMIIVDETLSNMDSESVDKFEEWILSGQQEHPITWIMISHRLAHIYRLCDRIHFFSEGHVVASGTRDEVLFENQDERIRRFISKEIIVEDKGEIQCSF